MERPVASHIMETTGLLVLYQFILQVGFICFSRLDKTWLNVLKFPDRYQIRKNQGLSHPFLFRLLHDQPPVPEIQPG